MDYNAQNTPPKFDDMLEEDKIGRNVLIWLNTLTKLPDFPVSIISYEFLPEEETPCMAISTVQGTYVINRNIIGGYEAEYAFKIIYRVRPGNSIDRRLQADELLNQIGEWAKNQNPDLGENIIVESIEPVTLSSLFGTYKDGSEDHQIFLKLTYKVSPF